MKLKHPFASLIFALTVAACVATPDKQEFGEPLATALDAYSKERKPEVLTNITNLLPDYLGKPEHNLAALQGITVVFRNFVYTKKDLKAGQAYFESLFKKEGLLESQELDLQERITVLKEWQSKKRMPTDSAKELLKVAKERNKSPMNDFKWSENYYLKELIRRYPGTNEANEALTTLSQNIKMGYAESGEEQTPLSLQEMLLSYEAMAKSPQRQPRAKNYTTSTTN